MKNSPLKTVMDFAVNTAIKDQCEKMVNGLLELDEQLINATYKRELGNEVNVAIRNAHDAILKLQSILP